MLLTNALVATTARETLMSNDDRPLSRRGETCDAAQGSSSIERTVAASVSHGVERIDCGCTPETKPAEHE